MDCGIDDGFNQAADNGSGNTSNRHVVRTAGSGDTDGSGSADRHSGERPPVAVIQSCLGHCHTGSGDTQELCLRFELGRLWDINDMVAFGTDGNPERHFKAEAGFVGGAAYLDEDTPVVRIYGIEREGVGHSRLDVQIALGNTGVDSGAAVQDGRQSREDQGCDEVSLSVAVHNHPHSGLGMRSPRVFIAAQQPAKMSGLTGATTGPGHRRRSNRPTERRSQQGSPR